MRLTRLSLERYGAFTGRDLAFRPDARLHVVLGANEAGKSTALAAVTDLLFGFEKLTRYAFLHDMPQLRLGAEVLAADGRKLAFRRRKGNVRTLIGADEAPLPDDALAPFLGGLTRPIFCRAFGLDAEALRAGGREMVEAEGEVGASLFAAGSGLRGLTELQGALETEAQEIFAPRRAGHRTFYQALDRHDEARKTIRDTELRAGAWRALNDEIAEAGARLDALRAERERAAAERARLERLRRARPILAEIDALEEALARARRAGEAGVPEPDPAWIARLGAALDACRTAEGEAARAEAALARARAEAEAVAVDPALTGRAEEILAGFEGTRNFDKFCADLPRVRADADRTGQELDDLRARVGVADLDALAAALPSDAARARIEALLREARTLDATEIQVARGLAEARTERDRHAQAVEALGAARDPGQLAEMLRPFARLRDDLRLEGELDGAVRRAEVLLRDRAGRLDPPVSDTAALARAPLPRPETVARFRALLDAKAREAERAADRGEAAARAAAGIRARLMEREAEAPVATRERLDALRAARAAVFARLREALTGPARVEPTEAAALVAAFERAESDADRLADARATDAARVAAHAADARSLAAAEAELREAAAALADRRAEAAEGEAAWREAWAPSGVAPGAPADMQAWLAEAAALIEIGQDIAEQRIARDRLRARIAAAAGPLSELCARAGLDPLPGLDPGAVLDLLEDRAAALADGWRAAREAAGLSRAADLALARREAERAEAEARRAAWRTAWAGAVAVLRLHPDAGADEAERALAAWRDVPGKRAEHAALTRRAAGIAREIEAYRNAAAGLVAALAPDLADMPASAGIRTLHARLVAAQALAVRRAGLDQRREEAERASLGAAEEAEAARRALLRLLAEHPTCGGEATVTSVADAAALHGWLDARARLAADLARLRARELAAAGDGVPEAELRAGLAEAPPEAIEAELARLAEAAEELAERGQRAFADRDRLERRRAELEGGTGAELALAERRAAEADLREAARSWAVLRLAGLMLGQAVARHRAGQQDPLLARAGALFRALTGGAYDGLGQTYDEADTPRLVGRRTGGGLVPIDGMSEGTRDQLYLALRLAHLEDYAGRAEPAPFVGDDLFASFDEARTGYGLDALAEIGARVQPILFTHHRHVAEIARARLGDAVDVLELRASG